MYKVTVPEPQVLTHLSGHGTWTGLGRMAPWRQIQKRSMELQWGKSQDKCVVCCLDLFGFVVVLQWSSHQHPLYENNNKKTTINRMAAMKVHVKYLQSRYTEEKLELKDLRALLQELAFCSVRAVPSTFGSCPGPKEPGTFLNFLDLFLQHTNWAL